MKLYRAFTILELIMVILIVGIISVIIAPNFQGNSLRYAADQIVGHIRYTQHLAMMDNKFSVTNAQWFKQRWQIRFSKTVGSDNEWSYTIYNDSAANTSDGFPNISEMAKNPINPTVQYLSGGYSAGSIKYSSSKATKELNIGHEYGIKGVGFSNDCNVATGGEIIAFDNLGRPLSGNMSNLDKEYKNGAKNMLLKKQCQIELCLGHACKNSFDSEKLKIAIEPETGYVHIL